MLRGYQGMGAAPVQRTAPEVEGQAEEREVEGPLGRPESEEQGRNISMPIRRY